MNVFLYPFKSKFAGQEEITIWAVNTDEPEEALDSSVTTSKKCPNCGARHVYKFVEDPFKEVDDEENEEIIQSYRCKCATCRKPFVAEIEFSY